MRFRNSEPGRLKLHDRSEANGRCSFVVHQNQRRRTRVKNVPGRVYAIGPPIWARKLARERSGTLVFGPKHPGTKADRRTETARDCVRAPLPCVGQPVLGGRHQADVPDADREAVGGGGHRRDNGEVRAADDGPLQRVAALQRLDGALQRVGVHRGRRLGVAGQLIGRRAERQPAGGRVQRVAPASAPHDEQAVPQLAVYEHPQTARPHQWRRTGGPVTDIVGIIRI